MKFIDVSESFEQIEKTASRNEITILLADLLKRATGNEAAIISNLSLGQLHPPYIGTQFNIAEKTMNKIVANVLDSTSEKISTLKKTVGDLGSIIAAGDWKADDKPTVLYVYDELDQIEKISGVGSQEEKAERLSALLKSLDSLSAKFIVRIVLGKLRLGFSDMTLLDAFSWMEVGNKSFRPIIENAYNTCADIGKIVKTLKDEGIQAVKEMKIHVGIPVLPAAAERLPSSKAILEKLGECVAQPKIDGFRLQIHINKHTRPQIHFFSRNLQDMSHMFPDLVDHLKDLDVDQMIAEGEAIGYDPNSGEFLRFQETVKRKRKHGIEEIKSEFPLKLFLFDLLFLNGESLLDTTHKKRRELLIAVLEKTKHKDIQPIEERTIENAEQLQAYFNEMIAEGLEGLVVKRPDAIYQPGKRNFNWIKLKRQAKGEIEDTLDCVILGYYAGSGKRAEFGIGAFLVGVFNKKEDMFETIAKIGTGLSHEGWKALKKRCDEHIITEQPHNVRCAKELVPDAWIAPEIVCVVWADEITQSPLHTAGKTEKELGFALRFPRIIEYRDDKAPTDVTTVAEIKRLYEDQFKKYN